MSWKFELQYFSWRAVCRWDDNIDNIETDFVDGNGSTSSFEPIFSERPKSILWARNFVATKKEDKVKMDLNLQN